MTKYSIVFLLIITSSCTSQRQVATTPTLPNNIVVNGKLFTALFQQQAAEYKALCFQAFNIARFRLDEALKDTSSRPRAIITDIDETMLDNSFYAVHQGLKGKDYDGESWR